MQIGSHNRKSEMDGGISDTKKLSEKLREEEEEEESDYYTDQKKRLEQFNRKYDTRKISHFIPALHMLFTGGSSKTLLYFHANAEDVVLSHELLDYMRVLLRVNIIAVEYPGYGLYQSKF